MAFFSSLHERANFLTHFAAFIFGVVAVPALVMHVKNSADAGFLDVLASVVYGITFLMAFGFSALYHYQQQPKRKRLMEIWDHISIYFLIAGTYTPFIDKYATRHDAVVMLSILWGLTAAGTVYKIFLTGKYRLISTIIYLAMGWMILAAPASFKAALTDESIYWIGLGGVFYTVGAVFYLVRRIPFNHAIWHLFVIGGAISHFVGVWTLF